MPADAAVQTGYRIAELVQRSAGSYLLGERFTMADVIFGGTLRFMLRFKMIEPRPIFATYAERLSARPALQRADAKNAAIIEQHGLGR